MLEYETPLYKSELERLAQISNDFFFGLQFCLHNSGRNINFWDNHLLSYTIQDILQSVFSIFLLAREGVRNPCKRELRFLIELAIKQCFIEQNSPDESVETKVENYRKLLKSPSISIKSKLQLRLLSEKTENKFLEEIGRFYGSTSKYVHLSPEQVLERISLINNGITAGLEGLNEIQEMIQFLRIGYAMVLVLIFHAVPEYVTGDFLVNSDGTSNQWYFRKSVYIADVDSHFDYKHERQEHLEQIRKARMQSVEF